MNRSGRRCLLITLRTAWMGFELGLAFARYFINVRAAKRNQHSIAQILWRQRVARRLLRVFNLHLSVSGGVPRAGLIVSNHLSYLDILILSAVASAVFVAKSEVRSWPIVGALARMAGTIFVDRARKTETPKVCQQMIEAIGSGGLVVLFPEGTSSNGESVLTFRPALLEPAVQLGCAITSVGLHYFLAEGSVAEEVCFWREMTLVPHLQNLLGKTQVSASVCFELAVPASSRKQLACSLHAQVVFLKKAAAKRNGPFHSSHRSDWAGGWPVETKQPRPGRRLARGDGRRTLTSDFDCAG